MNKGFMYILECSDGSYYTGSTKDLKRRFGQHQAGEGANHTRKRLPVKLVYFEEYQRIDEAFYREKQIQGWGRKKKEALMNGREDLLPQLAIAYRDRGFEGLSHQALESISHQALESISHQATEGLGHQATEGLGGHANETPGSDDHKELLPEALEGKLGEGGN